MANRKQSWWWERIGCQLALRIQQWPLSFSFFVKSAYTRGRKSSEDRFVPELNLNWKYISSAGETLQILKLLSGNWFMYPSRFQGFFLLLWNSRQKNTRWKVRNLIFLKKDSTSWKSESIKCSPSKQGGPFYQPGCSHRKKYQMKSYKPSIPRKRQQFSY